MYLGKEVPVCTKGKVASASVGLGTVAPPQCDAANQDKSWRVADETEIGLAREQDGQWNDSIWFPRQCDKGGSRLGFPWDTGAPQGSV